MKTKTVCGYCGSVWERGDMCSLLMWMEVHVPHHAPAHRKCTDECERDATGVLARLYAEQASDVPDKAEG